MCPCAVLLEREPGRICIVGALPNSGQESIDYRLPILVVSVVDGGIEAQPIEVRCIASVSVVLLMLGGARSSIFEEILNAIDIKAAIAQPFACK